VSQENSNTPADALRFEERETEPDSDWLQVGNEFATVLVRRVRTRNGSRLEIRSPKRELSIFLDATLLDGLTWQTAESMSLLLEDPLEPFTRRPPDCPGSAGLTDKRENPRR
jgi:hypothetical protein